VGDAKLTLRALLPLLDGKEDRSWRQEIEQNIDRWWRILDDRANQDANPLNPQRVFHELSPRLPDNCILTCDSGTAAFWFARDLKLRRGMMASLSGGLASMGPALPYALAAKYAYPDRPVIALLGDGAMQMNGINALISIAHAWRRWTDPRLLIMVLRNDDLNMVTWEQRATEGDPRAAISQFVPAFPYAEYAQLLGLVGVRIDAPQSVGAAWDAALAADRPVLLEMVTDPNVPPAPPHLTGKQLKAYGAALVKGDREAIQTVLAAARQWWSGLFPPEGDEATPSPAAPREADLADEVESAAGEEDPGAALDSMPGNTRGGPYS
jgi:pyruvate dehydrogenase (quinone)